MSRRSGSVGFSMAFRCESGFLCTACALDPVFEQKGICVCCVVIKIDNASLPFQGASDCLLRPLFLGKSMSNHHGTPLGRIPFTNGSP